MTSRSTLAFTLLVLFSAIAAKASPPLMEQFYKSKAVVGTPSPSGMPEMMQAIGRKPGELGNEMANTLSNLQATLQGSAVVFNSGAEREAVLSSLTQAFKILDMVKTDVQPGQPEFLNTYDNQGAKRLKVLIYNIYLNTLQIKFVEGVSKAPAKTVQRQSMTRIYKLAKLANQLDIAADYAGKYDLE